MKVLAIAPVGAEFLYTLSSAHAVPSSSAEKIRSALNAARFRLRDGETWHLYDLSPFEVETTAATYQRFYIRSGRLFEGRN